MRVACDRLAPIAEHHELVISHGNGPQIGLLALEEAAYEEAPDAPLDVLGAETQGMIGYLIEQELGNRLPFDKPLASLLTMIEVDPDDPAFARSDASRSARSTTRPRPTSSPPSAAGRSSPTATACGASCRRRRRSASSSTGPIRWLLEQRLRRHLRGRRRDPDRVPAAAGSSSASRPSSTRTTPAACSARDVDADILIMATDAPAAFVGFGTPEQRAIARGASRRAARRARAEFAAGSMLPKVIAACDFARATGKPAVIGALADIEAMLAGTAGTRVSTDVDGVVRAQRRLRTRH